MKIAIVKLSAMGDIIHAMVALQYIKIAKPNIEIDWIVEESFVSILEANPHISNILAVNLKSIKKNIFNIFAQKKLVNTYVKNNYDLIIDAQGLIKSGIVTKILGKNRAGFSKNSIREGLASSFYTQTVEIAYDANTIDRNVRVLAEPLDLEITKQMILDKKPFLFYRHDEVLNALSLHKKNIIFVIGSTWESRNYPKEKFAQIAETLAQNVVITWGSNSERLDAEWIASETQYAKALPKINLNALKAIIGESDLLIGNDTGPTHMAWAMNIPSITIFGPTPTNRVYETKINKVIASNSEVNHYKLDKNDFSIKDIPASKIIAIARELLDA
ncbi:Lipopolysaccharide heptosyltransferase I [hydrothermal vent metagenome]|uniref:Lipopolysaccharide heptosyltransferase 1 n=1 Tax=hydrothermal vent metagenome TaxID=652676 RepID=A0A1W1C139_9ZZZZ